jgi:hypothetical protein
MSRSHPNRSHHDAAVHVLLAGVFADWHARGVTFSALPDAPVVDDRPTRRPQVPGPARRLATGLRTAARNILARSDRPAARRHSAHVRRAGVCSCSPTGSVGPTGT